MAGAHLKDRTEKELYTVVAMLLGTTVVFSLVIIYGFFRIPELTSHIHGLEERLTSQSAAFTQNLGAATSSLHAVEQEVLGFRTQIGGVESKVDTISGTVSDLKTISSIDSELLTKYTKVFF